MEKIKAPRDFGVLTSLKDLKTHNVIVQSLQENIETYKQRFFQSQIITSVDEVLEQINSKDYDKVLKNTRRYIKSTLRYTMSSWYSGNSSNNIEILTEGTIDKPKRNGRSVRFKTTKIDSQSLETILKSFTFVKTDIICSLWSAERNPIRICGFMFANYTVIPIFAGSDEIIIKEDKLIVWRCQSEYKYRYHDFNRNWKYYFCMRTNKYLHTNFYYESIDRRL